MFARRRHRVRRRRQYAPATYTAIYYKPLYTMKKETLWFHNFCAWFSFVSPISIGMGLRSPAFRTGEVPL